MSRIKELEGILQRASDAYYNTESTMSDAEYDRLVQELKELSADSPVLAAVGAPISSGKSKVKHAVPMLSIEKAMTNKELYTWLRTRSAGAVEYTATAKLDGMSVNLDYIDGKLISATSRGDGVEGEDITLVLQQIAPKEITTDDAVSVRGELVISRDAFTALNSENERLGLRSYANARNAVVGIVGSGSPLPHQVQAISLIVYELVNSQNRTYTQDLAVLSVLGFSIPFALGMSCLLDFMAAEETIAAFTERRNQKLGHDCLWDGVVFRVEDNSVANDLGRTAAFWRRSVAWKFPAECVLVSIKDVEWSVGTSAISPVAVIEPTECGGVVVERVALHNVAKMRELCAYPSSPIRCRLYRSGDVIPTLGLGDCVLEKERRFHQLKIESIVPTRCPECMFLTFLSADYRHLSCTNPSCPGKLSRKVAIFAKAIGVDGVGPVIASKLVEDGLVSKVTDLLDLRNNVTATFIEEVGNKVVENLLVEIDRAKERVHVPERVISGLSISGVGQETARKILDVVGGIRQLGGMRTTELIKDEVVSGICAACDDITAVCTSLKFPEVVISKNPPPERMVVTITGDIAGTTRQEYADLLAQKGIRVASSVVKNCSYLICDNPSQSSKTKRAEKLGVPVVSRADFEKAVNL